MRREKGAFPDEQNTANGRLVSHRQSAKRPESRTVKRFSTRTSFPSKFPDFAIWKGQVEEFLARLPRREIFDLTVTSPPYNLGKAYETKKDLESYLDWQREIIRELIPRLKKTGSLCWQVGNYVSNGQILPLDIEFDHIFRKEHGLQLRNRIIWHFGHGLHNKRRFSGRYEVVLWYTKTDDYIFDLDAVRVPSKYPGKRHFKGSRAGELSGNPKGKNPEDVWIQGTGPSGDFWCIPNVKNNHVEKTSHPCQFPVALIERLVMALSKKNGLVMDPFAGAASAGVAAAIHNRRFIGCEVDSSYVKIGMKRIQDVLNSNPKYRPHDKPIYDPRRCSQSKIPEEWVSRTGVPCA